MGNIPLTVMSGKYVSEKFKEELWNIYKDDFLRNAVSGLPEWYKKKLALGDDG